MSQDAVAITLDDGREVWAGLRTVLPQRGVYEVREGGEMRFAGAGGSLYSGIVQKRADQFNLDLSER